MSDKNKLLSLVSLNIKNQILNLVNEKSILSTENIDEYKIPSFGKINDRLNTLILNLKDNLEKPSNERISYIESIYSTIEQIKFEYISCIQRRTALKLCHMRIADELNSRSDKNDINKYDIKQIFNHCVNFLSSFDESNSSSSIFKKKYMSKILGVFPMTMAKENFNDYVEKGLLLLFNKKKKDVVMEDINRLKVKFYPFAEDNLHIGKNIVEIFNSDVTALTSEQIVDNLDLLESEMEIFPSQEDFLCMMYSNCMYLINLALYCVDEDYLFGQDYLLKDMVNSLYDNLKSNTLDIFAENLIEMSEVKIEETFSQIKNLEEQLQNIDHLEDSSTEIILKTNVNICNNFYSDLRFDFKKIDFLNSDDDVCSDKFLNNEISKFIEYIEYIINPLVKKQSKLLKQNFLEEVPYPYKDSKFYESLKIYLEDISDSMNCKTILESIIYLIESSNIFSIPEYIDNHLTENTNIHNHSHGCSCNHHA